MHWGWGAQRCRVFRPHCESKTMESAYNAGSGVLELRPDRGGTASMSAPGTPSPGALCLCVQGWVTTHYFSFSLEEYQAPAVLNVFMAGTELLVCPLHHYKGSFCPEWRLSGVRKKGGTYSLVTHLNHVKPSAAHSTSQEVGLVTMLRRSFPLTLKSHESATTLTTPSVLPPDLFCCDC